MTTYFHGNSEIQGGGGGGDGLQTLILMNPSYIGYADNQQPQPQPQPQRPQTNNNNLIFFNNSTATGNTLNLPPHHHHQPSTQTQPFLGTPIQSNDISSFHHGLLPRIHHYNMYNSQIDHIGEAREVTRAQQGLSLSLSSQNPPPGYGSVRVDDVKVSSGSPSSASGVSNGVNHGLILSSKYLKAAQELLEEVVNVGNGGKIVAELSKNIGESSAAAAAAVSGDGQSGGEGCSVKRGGAELTTAERQEIQMKKAKLVNMLDEVEQRYKQYHQQMQIVISWFEQATGIGSAKTYTALALQTISKQFRCLKDAILGQIRATSKSLGEENSLGTGKIEGSRLKYVDNQIRQQNALQQLGMIQHNNAWRPQRGLPERSVSVLRAWLFEHFLHPYPKDSDKIMLAKQTGLTRSQVSNWFINARVRLWKPMVEEMYTEEMKENEKNGSEDKTEQNQDSTSKSPKQDNPIINQTTPPPTSMAINSGFNLIGPSEIETTTQQSPKKHRFNISSIETDSTDQMSMKFEIERQSRPDGFTFMGAPTNFIGGFGSYPIGELGRFGPDQFQSPYSNNGVSLTLGLPHCENISMTGAHQTFEIGESNDFHTMNNNNQTSNVYENINIQNRKRFAAQLLPDFVT